MTADKSVRTLESLESTITLVALGTLWSLETLRALQSFAALDYTYAFAAPGAADAVGAAADDYLKSFGITVRSAPAMFYCDIKRVLWLDNPAGTTLQWY
jgi:hypothetical protein